MFTHVQLGLLHNFRVIFLSINSLSLKFELSVAMLLKWLFWICFWGVNVLALSPAPYLPPLDIFNWWDKAQHATGFGTLAILASLAYPRISKYRVGVLLCLQGVAIEVLQYVGGYRYGDWQDAVADAVGVLLGLVLAKLILKRLLY